MDNESQAQLARGGRPSGVRNYQNNVLIDIVERLLPQGLEGWREVDATITLPDAATLLPRCRRRRRAVAPAAASAASAAAALPPPPPPCCRQAAAAAAVPFVFIVVVVAVIVTVSDAVAADDFS
jgi:hypothetical protein